MNTTLSIAFLAGVISFLSPCVLPLIPGYISYISGTSLEKLVEKKKQSSNYQNDFFHFGFLCYLCNFRVNSIFSRKVFFK